MSSQICGFVPYSTMVFGERIIPGERRSAILLWWPFRRVCRWSAWKIGGLSQPSRWKSLQFSLWIWGIHMNPAYLLTILLTSEFSIFMFFFQTALPKWPRVTCKHHPYGSAQGYCYAAGMAQLEDGAFYAAAPQEAEAAETWDFRWGSSDKSGSVSKEIWQERTQKKNISMWPCEHNYRKSR